jgi:superfamily II DNA or RNA helicase
VDRDSIQRLRREYGMHVNPWTSCPGLITSMDFLKREQPLRLFRDSLQQTGPPLRDWDLLIVDEAHNIAPSGRSTYAVDSDAPG